MEHTEPGGYDATVSAATFGSGPTTLTFDVPAFGYLRRLLLLIEASGGDGTGGAAVAQADAPWSFIKSITFKDVNGGNIVGPLSGYQLYLLNKWGGYSHDDNPVNDPCYIAMDTDGDFSYRLDVPLEAIARDALAALPNLNSASAYKVELVVADDGDVYSTVPDTNLPDVRIRAILDAWSKPSAQDPRGNAQMTNPPNEKTTQFWSVATSAVSGAGEVTWRLPRVGNFLRNLIFVFRDSGGAREGDTFASTVKLMLDGQTIHNEPTAIRRAIMAEQYGYAIDPVATAGFDEAVLAYPFTHDFDGKPGGELRDLWLPTVQSSRLEITLANAGEAGTVECLTNDISIAAA
ncbi:MAG: hypothetical protein GY771_05325 [bacterium]|nr:hypothetical protein [bacterium]